MMDRCQALFTGKFIEYGTPRKLYDELNEEFHFVLDPCTTANNPLRTPYYYTIVEDGLKQSWNVDNNDNGGGSSVYVNPPYGKNITDWVKKASDESARHNITIVMLLPARTDTRFFHDYIYDNIKHQYYDGVQVRWIRGRLKFITSVQDSLNTAPFPSMLVIFNKSVKSNQSAVN
jgi:site-specific DNA-methyltransferase (adenine-specific)